MNFFVIAFALTCLLGFTNAQPDAASADKPTAEYLPPVADVAETKLADDGYRYKTVRRLKYRHRRDVSQEYLPPIAEPTQEYLPPVAETKLADYGYRYKTVRKIKYRARHRRDVADIEAPTKDYLPPVEVELAPELKTILGDDGYRYKTVRRLKYRRHRREAGAADEKQEVAADAEEVAAVKEYLPPASEAAASEDAPELKSAELANDGYRYRTVRRQKYRYRH